MTVSEHQLSDQTNADVESTCAKSAGLSQAQSAVSSKTKKHKGDLVSQLRDQLQNSLEPAQQVSHMPSIMTCCISHTVKECEHIGSADEALCTHYCCTGHVRAFPACSISTYLESICHVGFESLATRAVAQCARAV